VNLRDLICTEQVRLLRHAPFTKHRGGRNTLKANREWVSRTAGVDGKTSKKGRGQQNTEQGKLRATFPSSQACDTGLAGVKDSRSPLIRAHATADQSWRRGREQHQPRTVLPASLEGAFSPGGMGCPGRITIPQQQQEGPAPAVCKGISSSALLPASSSTRAAKIAERMDENRDGNGSKRQKTQQGKKKAERTARAGDNGDAPRTELPAVNWRSVASPSKSEGCAVRLSTTPTPSHHDGNEERHSTSIYTQIAAEGEHGGEQQPPSARSAKAQVFLQQTAAPEQPQGLKDLLKNQLIVTSEEGGDTARTWQLACHPPHRTPPILAGAFGHTLASEGVSEQHRPARRSRATRPPRPVSHRLSSSARRVRGPGRLEGGDPQERDTLTGHPELDAVLVVRPVQHLLASVVAFVLHAQPCDAQRAAANQGETGVRGEGDA